MLSLPGEGEKEGPKGPGPPRGAMARCSCTNRTTRSSDDLADVGRNSGRLGQGRRAQQEEVARWGGRRRQLGKEGERLGQARRATRSVEIKSDFKQNKRGNKNKMKSLFLQLMLQHNWDHFEMIFFHKDWLELWNLSTKNH